MERQPEPRQSHPEGVGPTSCLLTSCHTLCFPSAGNSLWVRAGLLIRPESLPGQGWISPLGLRAFSEKEQKMLSF